MDVENQKDSSTQNLAVTPTSIFDDTQKYVEESAEHHNNDFKTEPLTLDPPTTTPTETPQQRPNNEQKKPDTNAEPSGLRKRFVDARKQVLDRMELFLSDPINQHKHEARCAKCFRIFFVVIIFVVATILLSAITMFDIKDLRTIQKQYRTTSEQPFQSFFSIGGVNIFSVWPFWRKWILIPLGFEDDSSGKETQTDQKPNMDSHNNHNHQQTREIPLTFNQWFHYHDPEALKSVASLRYLRTIPFENETMFVNNLNQIYDVEHPPQFIRVKQVLIRNKSARGVTSASDTQKQYEEVSLASTFSEQTVLTFDELKLLKFYGFRDEQHFNELFDSIYYISYALDSDNYKNNPNSFRNSRDLLIEHSILTQEDKLISLQSIVLGMIRAVLAVGNVQTPYLCTFMIVGWNHTFQSLPEFCIGRLDLSRTIQSSTTQIHNPQQEVLNEDKDDKKGGEIGVLSAVADPFFISPKIIEKNKQTQNVKVVNWIKNSQQTNTVELKSIPNVIKVELNFFLFGGGFSTLLFLESIADDKQSNHQQQFPTHNTKYIAAPSMLYRSVEPRQNVPHANLLYVFEVIENKVVTESMFITYLQHIYSYLELVKFRDWYLTSVHRQTFEKIVHRQRTQEV